MITFFSLQKLDFCGKYTYNSLNILMNIQLWTLKR